MRARSVTPALALVGPPEEEGDRLVVPENAWDAIVGDLLERCRYDRETAQIDKAFGIVPEDLDDIERTVLESGRRSRRGPMPKEWGAH